MSIKDIILYALLAILFIWALFRLNIIGVRKGVKKSARQRDEEKVSQRKRVRMIWLMKQFDSLSSVLHIQNKEQEFELKYVVERCDIRIKTLERTIKLSELIGIFRFIQFVDILAFILVFSFTLQWSSLLVLAGLFIPKGYIGWLKLKILSEDEELEAVFPDLYLLLYSRLVKGAHTQIEPTVHDYVDSLDDMYGKGVGHKAIRKWCARFIVNVEIYGDETMAIKHIRDYYRSPTVTNFCNLAIQALSGVDNADKLLTFKQELAEQRRVAMDLQAEKLVRKGTRAIYIIYFILFEFIVLSWVSKIDLSLFNVFF